MADDSLPGGKFIAFQNFKEAHTKLKEALHAADLESAMMQDTPNSKSKLVFFSNVRYVFYSNGNPRVGSNVPEENQCDFVPPLPQFVKSKSSISSMRGNSKSKLCMFYAIREGLLKKESHVPNVESLAELFCQFRRKAGMTKPSLESLKEEGLSLLGWGKGCLTQHGVSAP